MKKIILLIVLNFTFFLSSNAQIVNNSAHKIKSKFFKVEREIKVHLPKNFTEKENLPVIYLFDAQWDVFFNLTTSIADYLIETKEFPRSIIVGINSTNRQYELTPEPVNEDWKQPSLGGAKLLENHLSNEVFPFIDSLYKSSPFRIGVGHSLGGTFILNSIIDNPKLFNGYIAFSPNLQIDDEEIVIKIKRNILQAKQANKFIFTTIGTKGNVDTSFLPSIKKLDTIMQKHSSSNFNWNFLIYEGFNHATIPLETIHNGLIKLAKKWKVSKEEKKAMILSENPLSGFNNFFISLSQWTGYKNLPTLDDYYDFGYFLQEHKMYNEAVKVYKQAIKNNSKISQLYSKIGEELIRCSNKKEAKKYFIKALEVLEVQKEDFNNLDTYKYFKKTYKNNIEKLNLF